MPPIETVYQFVLDCLLVRAGLEVATHIAPQQPILEIPNTLE